MAFHSVKQGNQTKAAKYFKMAAAAKVGEEYNLQHSRNLESALYKAILFNLIGIPTNYFLSSYFGCLPRERAHGYFCLFP